MRNVTLEELLEAGCHFGHQVTRQNPKAREYIFEARDNIHIIDLAKTKEGLDEAASYVFNLAKKGGTMIILGTKRQAEAVVRENAQRVKEAGANGLYFVTNRWVGGLLTNFQEVSKNFKRLKELTEILNNPSEKARFTKKELSLLEKERAKLESFYWGVQDMNKIPDAVFIIDTHLEQLAVKEAHALGVTTVGITDTNADPTLIDYPIPANDDAVGSIKLIVDHIVDAWIEGKVGTEAVKKTASKPESGKETDSSSKEKTKAQESSKATGEATAKGKKTVEKETEKKESEKVKSPNSKEKSTSKNSKIKKTSKNTK
jgi:small subunit ribosomal protein S2